MGRRSREALQLFHIKTSMKIHVRGKHYNYFTPMLQLFPRTFSVNIILSEEMLRSITIIWPSAAPAPFIPVKPPTPATSLTTFQVFTSHISLWLWAQFCANCTSAFFCCLKFAFCFCWYTHCATEQFEPIFAVTATIVSVLSAHPCLQLWQKLKWSSGRRFFSSNNSF